MSIIEATHQELIDRTRSSLRIGTEEDNTYPFVNDFFTVEEDAYGVTVWYVVVGLTGSERKGAYFRRVGENRYEV